MLQACLTFYLGTILRATKARGTRPIRQRVSRKNTRRWQTTLWLLSVLVTLPLPRAFGQQRLLQRRVEAVTGRAEFRHSQFGIEILDVATGSVVFARNQHLLLVPGSTTKVVTEGTALALLGADFRFHTHIYRTGQIDNDGTLNGDLVLVAAGDPNLSARVQPDDTLAFTDADHSYAGTLPGNSVPGDPLLVLKEMARQVAVRGVRRITGRVIIDASLFTADKPEPNSGVMISPIVVNDNVVDVIVSPGVKEGDPTSILVSPLQPYVTVLNRSTTGSAEGGPELHFTDDIAHPDGTHTVTLVGSVPAGWRIAQAAYKVKDPVRFAEFALVTALQSVGIQAKVTPVSESPTDYVKLTALYSDQNRLAEHISPPFSEEVKVTLKASQNLHAAMIPYLIGALIGHQSSEAAAAGFALERQVLLRAGLDLTAASQADGAGGPGAAFTPDFMARWLSWVARQPFGGVLIKSLPILGRDGTLRETERTSTAAGHVFGKTGTYVLWDALNHNLLLLNKGLVGYIDTRRGRRLAFAIYVNQVPTANMDEVENVGSLLASIAAAAYDADEPAPGTSGKPRSAKLH